MSIDRLTRKLIKWEDFEHLALVGTREEILAALRMYVKRPKTTPETTRQTPAHLRMRRHRLRKLLGVSGENSIPILSTTSLAPLLDRPPVWELLPIRIYKAYTYLKKKQGTQFETYRDIISVSARELNALPNVGWKSIRKLEEHLDLLGLKLRD